MRLFTILMLAAALAGCAATAPVRSERPVHRWSVPVRWIGDLESGKLSRNQFIADLLMLHGPDAAWARSASGFVMGDSIMVPNEWLGELDVGNYSTDEFLSMIRGERSLIAMDSLTKAALQKAHRDAILVRWGLLKD